MSLRSLESLISFFVVLFLRIHPSHYFHVSHAYKLFIYLFSLNIDYYLQMLPSDNKIRGDTHMTSTLRGDGVGEGGKQN